MKEYIIPFADDADIEKLEQIHGTNGELIRCKECKYWEQERRDKEFGDCMYHLSLTRTSDFCSYAERKEKGCWNCEHQIEPLRACEWLEKGGDGVVHMTCPRWTERKEE